MRCKFRSCLTCDLIQSRICQRLVLVDSPQAHAIEIAPRLESRCGLDPRLKPLLDKFREYRDGLFLPKAHFALSQAGTVRRFHLAGNLVIALLRGFPHELAFPHEFVPIHATGMTLAALPATAIRAFLVTAAFVDHRLPRFDFFFPLPFGLPPSFPHSCIRRSNSALPHSLIRTSALRRPIKLAALLASLEGCLGFT